MKIRNGFVSNSSSSSFCVFGVYIEDPDALCDKLMGEIQDVKTKGCSHDIDRDKLKFCPECGARAWNIKTKKRYANEELDSYFNFDHKELSLDSVTWSGGEKCKDGIYIGIDLKDSKINEAPSKSKAIETVEYKLKEMFPDLSPKFYNDADYEN